MPIRVIWLTMLHTIVMPSGCSICESVILAWARGVGIETGEVMKIFDTRILDTRR